MSRTPGPWGIQPCQCGHPICKRLQPGPGFFYAGTGYDPDDAKSIQAVPDMIDALQEALKWFPERTWEGGEENGQWKPVGQAKIKARIAIVAALVKAGVL